MIQGLPEKDAITAEPTTSAAEDASVPKARLTDLYEQEVLDYVASKLDQGVPETRIIEALKPHDFGKEEARRLIRAVAKERPKPQNFANAAPPSSTKSKTASPRSAKSEAVQLDEAIVVEMEAAQKQMLFGAIWFFGGIVVTIGTFAANIGAGGILFWGAVVWGAIIFARGANRASALNRLRNEHRAEVGSVDDRGR